MARARSLTTAMAALHRIAHPEAEIDGPHACAVCGGPSIDRHSSRDIMAETFVRFDVFRVPDASFVCDACAWYLDASGKRRGGAPHPRFNTMSYVIWPDRWESIERLEIGPLLDQFPSGPPHPLWLILSRQKKKHLAILASPWLAGNLVTIQFEEDTIRIRRDELEELRRLIGCLLQAGIGKTAIGSGRLPSVALRARDIRLITGWMRDLDPWRPSAALHFALWIARSPEREEGPVSGRLPQPRV